MTNANLILDILGLWFLLTMAAVILVYLIHGFQKGNNND